MRSSARRVAYCAVLTALGALFLLLANVLPAGRLALFAVASFSVCAALMLYGPGWAAGVFAVTAALGFLLFPGVTAVGYAAFFGWYPIVKSLCERLHNKYLGWGLKCLAYSAAAVLYRVFAEALFAGAVVRSWALLYLMGLAAFLVFDWAYSLLIRLYIEKIARFIK